MMGIYHLETNRRDAHRTFLKLNFNNTGTNGSVRQ